MQERDIKRDWVCLVSTAVVILRVYIPRTSAIGATQLHQERHHPAVQLLSPSCGNNSESGCQVTTYLTHTLCILLINNYRYVSISHCFKGLGAKLPVNEGDHQQMERQCW